MKKVLACILMVVFVFTLCSCRSSKTVFVNLSENIEPIEIKRQNLSDDFISAQQNFALNLFATEYKKERQNINISPYSLSFALGIVASGAQGDTLSQFETFLMNGMYREEWNKNMFSYLKKNKNRFSQADSLWIAQNKSNVKETFLQNAKGYFGANVYSLNFKNKEAVREVNNWAKENTQGKIQEIADDIDSNTTMYVANALYIDILWATTHRASDVKEEFFTCANGEKSTVKMMYSTLEANQQTYICDENAEGFIKKCQGDYKFIAIMPNEDVNMVDYINSFDATYLNSIMSNSQNITLKTAMPQFVIENSVDFRETLIEMGIKNAYDAKNADFNDISENSSLYMGKTLQKTCINVDIGGIKAVASSGQEMIMLGIIPTEEKEIILNRPFIYIIADKYNIPLFIGAVTKL